jgi:hypothetical protein
MVKCKECGLLERRDKNPCCIRVNPCCIRFKREITIKEIFKEKECPYFYNIIWENEEPLSPLQHLIMQNEELKSRKMQGPV